MLGGEIVAGHIEWPAEIVPLWHGEEGGSDVVLHCFVWVGGYTIGGMEPLS
jgi:hypothetical protein